LRTASGSEVSSIFGSSKPPCRRAITDPPPAGRARVRGRTSGQRR
jgi:hypothetical protein